IRDFHVTGVQTCALPIDGGVRSPGGERLRLRHGGGAGRHVEVRGLRHPPLLRERPALPGVLPCLSGGAAPARKPNPAGGGRSMKVPREWLAAYVDVDEPAEVESRQMAAIDPAELDFPQPPA